MYKRLKPFNRGFLFEFANSIQIDYEKEINQSQKEEASKFGLELLNRTSNPNYNLYRHVECNHFQFLQPTHVRRNAFSCSTCSQNRLVQQAHENGFTYLFHHSNTAKRYIKPCGHIANLIPQAVSKSKAVNCNECYQEKLLACSERFGYEILQPEGTGRSLIRFRDCQHQKVVVNQQILRGNIVCTSCRLELLVSEVAEHGLKHKEYIPGGQYSIFELPCGHDKLLRNCHAREGNYLCDVCGESHYQKPSMVYLFEFKYEDFSWLKLGYSRNLRVRKNNYGLPKETETNVLYVMELDKGSDAHKIERELHKQFKPFRHSKGLMLNYHSSNGFTECYDISVKQKLLDALHEIERERKHFE